uniref:Uncharacterized protein n=1 Tax=Strombidium inclinatum TaxID=197538 RepID=A0A7S3IM34_9SPIT|mmetsp:Transcript_24718/g.38486  ORF Transcript_24718/g.38486 Transcript_24718/m.38486 type:complete len:100 (+) Transcript_24718:1531-1830(+)
MESEEVPPIEIFQSPCVEKYFVPEMPWKTTQQIVKKYSEHYTLNHPAKKEMSCLNPLRPFIEEQQEGANVRQVQYTHGLKYYYATRHIYPGEVILSLIP